jgi:hypothetical protein
MAEATCSTMEALTPLLKGIPGATTPSDHVDLILIALLNPLTQKIMGNIGDDAYEWLKKRFWIKKGHSKRKRRTRKKRPARDKIRASGGGWLEESAHRKVKSY